MKSFITRHKDNFVLTVYLLGYVLLWPIITKYMDIGTFKIEIQIGFLILLSILLLIFYKSQIFVRRGFGYLGGLLTGIGAYFLSIVITIILFSFLPNINVGNSAIQQGFNEYPNLMFICSCICGPFIEEIAFRHCLYNKISGNLNSTGLSVTITSLLFGAAHCIPFILTGNYVFLWRTILYLPLAFMCQLEYNRDGDLRECVLTHVIYNILSVCMK